MYVGYKGKEQGKCNQQKQKIKESEILAFVF